MSNILKVAIFIFSSQVGSGVFILPAVLAVLGYKALMILVIVGIVCTLITKIFAETGKNSYELIGDAFGQRIGKIFFLLYWFISWFSTIVLFKELIGYLGMGPTYSLVVEIVIWLWVTLFNMWSFRNVIILETILTALKLLPFIGLVLVYVFNKTTGFIADSNSMNITLLLKLFLRCLWGFVGLETGNIIAKNLDTTQSERRKGTYLGMIAVVLFYVLSVLFCFQICGTANLIGNTAPYITVFQKGLYQYLSQDTISLIIKYIIVTVLIGSINSWTISTGYVGYEGALLKILPGCFAKLNKHKTPYMSVLLSSLCILIFIFLSHNPNIYSTTLKFVDISSCFFLFIYGMCVLSYALVALKGIRKYTYILLALLINGCFVYEIYQNIMLFFV